MDADVLPEDRDDFVLGVSSGDVWLQAFARVTGSQREREGIASPSLGPFWCRAAPSTVGYPHRTVGEVAGPGRGWCGGGGRLGGWRLPALCGPGMELPDPVVAQLVLSPFWNGKRPS